MEAGGKLLATKIENEMASRGDVNTNFFHQSTLQRRMRNKVLKIKDKNGEWIECPMRVKETIDKHFVHFFTSTGHREWGTILDCIQLQVTADMNSSLIAPVSTEEVKDAILQMGGLKALDHDGFQGIFDQSI